MGARFTRERTERHGISARAKIASAIGIVAFFVLAGTGVAAASWTASSGATATVSAATTAMTLTPSSGTATLDTGATPYKFAGAATNSPVFLRSVALKNTGTAPLTYALSVADSAGNALAAVASAITVTLWTSSTACTTTVGTGSTIGTLATLPGIPSTAATQAPGVSATLCILTKLNTTVAQSQGLSVTAVFTVTGTVGMSAWNTNASDTAFTQVVYRIGSPANPVCRQAGGINSTATISWTAPSVSGGTITYSIVDQTTGAAVSGATISGTTAQFNYSDLSGASETVLVKATDSVYGTVSTGLPFSLSQSGGLLGIVFTSVSCVSPAAS